MQIVADISQVQAVAQALGLPVARAADLFGQACADGTVDAVRRYVMSRMGPTAEEIEARAVPGRALDPLLVQIIIAAGVAGGWFLVFDVNPAPASEPVAPVEPAP